MVCSMSNKEIDLEGSTTYSEDVGDGNDGEDNGGAEGEEEEQGSGQETPTKKKKGKKLLRNWHAVLSKGIIARVDKGLKSSTADGSLLAAILSANYYGRLKKAAFLKHTEAGFISPRRKSSLTDSNHQESTKSSEALSNMSKGDLDCEPETINMWELMKGLEDDDVDGAHDSPSDLPKSSVSLLQPSVSHASKEPDPSNPPKLYSLNLDCDSERHDIVDAKSPVLGPSDMSAATPATHTTNRRFRPKSFNLLHTVQDAISLARKSKMPPAACDNSLTELADSRKLGTHDSSKQSRSISKLSDSKEFDGNSFLDSARNANNLQRALSFKYILNDSNSDQSQDTSTNTESFLSQYCKNISMHYTHPTLDELGEIGFPSIPHTSAPRVRSCDSPDNGLLRLAGDSKNAFRYGSSVQSMLNEDLQFQHSEPATPIHYHSSQAHPKYGPNPADQPFKALHDQPKSMKLHKLFTQSEESERSMLNPEFLQSFEKTMEQLSEEEWNAVATTGKSLKELHPTQRSSLKVATDTVSSSVSGEGKHTSANGNPNVPLNRNLPRRKGKMSLESDRLTVSSMLQHKMSPTKDAHKNHSLEERKMPSSRRRNSVDVQAKAEDAQDQDDRNAVVFYSTDSLTDTKVFENCNAARAILSLLVGASFDERNILQYPDFEQELRHVLGLPVVIVPTLVVKGRLVIGIDNILQLYQKGILATLLKEALPEGGFKSKAPCVCRGGKFLICSLCKGRGKLSRQREGALSCRHCSGTGLVKCSNC